MRAISFVDHIDLEFTGNILEQGLTLGDVDGDGDSELVVANVVGDLFIFKGVLAKPWRQYRKLGMVSCVVVGDLCNVGTDVLFCITCEGWSHLMSFAPQGNQQENEEKLQHEDDISTFHQSLPTNSKVAIIADVDGDGKNELVTGSTDRVVRIFKWVPEPSKKESADSEVKEKTATKVPAKQGKVLKKQSSKEGRLGKSSAKDGEDIPETGDSSPDKTTASSAQTTSESIFNGKFVCVKRWKLSGQLESISVIEGRNGSSPAILVSQPGGSYLYLVCVEEDIKENLEKQIKQLTIQDSAFSFSDCRTSADTSTSHQILPDMLSIPTHLICWKFKPTRNQTTTSNFIAMCTLDGKLAIVKDDKMHWSLQIKHNFFSVHKLDITGSGREDVVFCAWDGETYIMDQYQNIVNFKFGENIMAFCAGTYALKSGTSAPCLVYVTFNSRVKLYCNVTMPRLESRNFTDTVVAKLSRLNLDPQYRDFMESSDGSVDNSKIKQLTSWCLYGGPPPDVGTSTSEDCQTDKADN